MYSRLHLMHHMLNLALWIIQTVFLYSDEYISGFKRVNICYMFTFILFKFLITGNKKNTRTARAKETDGN